MHVGTGYDQKGIQITIKLLLDKCYVFDESYMIL